MLKGYNVGFGPNLLGIISTTKTFWLSLSFIPSRSFISTSRVAPIPRCCTWMNRCYSKGKKVLFGECFPGLPQKLINQFSTEELASVAPILCLGQGSATLTLGHGRRSKWFQGELCSWRRRQRCGCCRWPQPDLGLKVDHTSMATIRIKFRSQHIFWGDLRKGWV